MFSPEQFIRAVESQLPKIEFGEIEDAIGKSCIAIRDYWASKHDGGDYPDMADIDPTGLWPHLSFAGLLQIQDDPHRYYVRVMGDKIEAIYGSMTKKTLDEALRPISLKRWHSILDTALEREAPLRMVSQMQIILGQTITGEAVVLPLRVGSRPVGGFLIGVHLGLSRRRGADAPEER